MKLDVVKNAKRNLIFGGINKVIVMLCPFVERTFIQQLLGAQYLGLNSLFTSILSVLALSELGLSSAIVYNMYKPVAEGDVQEVNRLLFFFRKAYKYIGLAILLFGILLTPFIKHLIKGDYPQDVNVYFVYLVFVFNSALSYLLFSYLSSIIIVHQRDDINSLINSGIKIALTLSEIGVLFITKNYYMFVLLMPVFTVLNNIWMAWLVKKNFPCYKPEGIISSERIKSIKKLVIGSFIQKACVVSRNSLDSICISAILGLTMTAIYNNYYVILAAVTSTLAIFSTSIVGGIGNHVATKKVDENFNELRILDFVYLWISGWCAICLLCLYQPFMTIWMGVDMLLPTNATILLSVYFYILTLGDMRLMYTSANGLWWEHRYRSITECAANLILNITLGKLFGVYGIILATIITMFLCNYIWGSYITFKFYFSKLYLSKYYYYQLKYTVITVVIGLVTYVICYLLPISSDLINFLVRLLVCIILPNLIYFMIYRRTKELQYVKSKVIKC